MSSRLNPKPTVRRRTGPAGRLLRGLVPAAFVGVWLASPSRACGPHFPNQLLYNARESLLWSPVADLRRELDLILPAGARAAVPRAVVPDRDSTYEHSAAVERADLKAALAAEGMEPRRAEAVLAEYEALRKAIVKHRSSLSDWREWRTDQDRPVFKPPAVPRGLPEDFRMYLTGMVEHLGGRDARAREIWRRLANDVRCGRRVSAAYMLGRSLLDSDPAKAIAWFRQTRALAKAGGSDNLGLAAASYGWEARAELNRGHFAAAIELYLLHLATGDHTAAESLAMVGQQLARAEPAVLADVAKHPAAARVMNAYLLAGGGPYRTDPPESVTHAWLAAVEAAGTADVVGADRLAWSAYQAGRIEAAERWLAKAPADAPIGHWLRSKLLLRQGNIDAATAELAKAVKAFPVDEHWEEVPGTYSSLIYGEALFPARRAAAELGVLHLSRGRYVESLDRLLKSGWWLDAAYVAERVLTADELKQYVDRNWPASKVPPPQAAGARTSNDEPNLSGDLRHLLARRLHRLGRRQEARDYFPPPLRPRLDAYLGAVRAGHDGNRAREDRAASLWEAATIARHEGMELLGTELGPDGFADGGNFDRRDVADYRRERAAEEQENLLAPRPDELRRAASHAPTPDRRFHYRFAAADHAWAAAELMPDEDRDTAVVLHAAGSWLAGRDPAAAERFYHALVNRCSTTRLGHAALRKRWFP